VKVVVLPGVRFERVYAVCGGSTRMQLAPFAWTQYHQFVELSVDAFHASETLVSELAVMWRFVGVVGACLSPGAGGRLAAVEAVRTRANTSTVPASAAVRIDIAPPGGADRFIVRYAQPGPSDCPSGTHFPKLVSGYVIACGASSIR
jgi:hypothetical protein